MKETFYFSHDYNARSDYKIKKLIIKHGYMGYGLYWAIIEDLYQNENSLKLDYEIMSYEYRTDPEVLERIVNDYNLFVVRDGFISSDSVERRLQERRTFAEKQREKGIKSALARKQNLEENSTTVQPDFNHSSTTLEPISKVKESKVKEIKEKESKVKESKIEPNLLYSTLSNFIFECKDKKVTLSNGEVQDLITKYPKINVHNKLEYLSAYLKKPDAKKPLSKNLMTLINTKFDNWNSDGDVPIPKQRYPLLK